MKHTFKSLRTLAVALTTFGSLAGGANAEVVIPVGIQQNVPFSTVTGAWGWTLVYQGTYNQTATVAELYAGVNPGDYIMYAARPIGSPTITLLAAADEADVRRVTARNQTTTSNGASWYYNGGSIGFARLGDEINQNTADIGSTNANLRLSWHTSGGYGNAPTSLNPGWRAGAATGLNNSTSWERLVFIPTPIPEPSSVLLLGLGSLAVAVRRRRI